MAARRICKFPFSYGAGPQTALIQELNPDDLSHAIALLFVVEFTTIGTDAGDTFDLKFQDTADRTHWNTRARFAQVIGTTTAPFAMRLNLQEDIAISTAEQSYTEGASGDATEIAKGTVRNGPICGFVRVQFANTFGRQAGWRMQFDIVDAGTQNGSWVGNVYVFADDNLN